jgi:hypothetical protein
MYNQIQGYLRELSKEEHRMRPSEANGQQDAHAKETKVYAHGISLGFLLKGQAPTELPIILRKADIG